MKRTVVGVLVAAFLVIGGPAGADSQPCNLKAVHHTAAHLANATNPARIARLQVRYDRLVAHCTAPNPHP